MTKERYFYHNFPRRGGEDSAAKGCEILRSIRDIGLLLVPEYIEWKQPTLSGVPRIFPVLQQRACFTELAPSEISDHAHTFGRFALEFRVEDLRKLGATPVFYIPQPTLDGEDGNAVGVGLISIAMDSANFLQRIAGLHTSIKDPFPAACDPDLIDLKVGFDGNPGQEKSFRLKVQESKDFLDAMGYMITPWADLYAGARMMMNFFYPADDHFNKSQLGYYRQREWRIAGQFAIKGVDFTRELTAEEKEIVRKIDPVFFDKQLPTSPGQSRRLDKTLALSGPTGGGVLNHVRRLLVPNEAIDEAKMIFVDTYPTLVIESIDQLEI